MRSGAIAPFPTIRSPAVLRCFGGCSGDDTHEPRYIATVPTVGYRFLCDVKVVEDGFAGPNAAGLPQPQDNDENTALQGTPVWKPLRIVLATLWELHLQRAGRRNAGK